MKKINKKLQLNVSSVRDLTVQDLKEVAGASQLNSRCIDICPYSEGGTCGFSCAGTCGSMCASVFGTLCTYC